MDTKGKFWYSEKQKNVIRATEGQHTNYAKLDDGSVVEYTEWKSGKWIDEPSNWDDAVCLGMGEYSHS